MATSRLLIKGSFLSVDSAGSFNSFIHTWYNHVIPVPQSLSTTSLNRSTIGWFIPFGHEASPLGCCLLPVYRDKLCKTTAEDHLPIDGYLHHNYNLPANLGRHAELYLPMFCFPAYYEPLRLPAWLELCVGRQVPKRFVVELVQGNQVS